MKQKTMELLEQAGWVVDDCSVFTHDQITSLYKMIECIKEAIENEAY